MQATISHDRLIGIFVQGSLLMDSCIDRKSDKWLSAVNWCQQAKALIENPAWHNSPSSMSDSVIYHPSKFNGTGTDSGSDNRAANGQT